MNILFVSFGELSVGRAIRSVSVLRALADAGHQVDVIASRVNLMPHPNIRVLCEEHGKPLSRRRVRMRVLKSISRNRYDVLHAIDDALICFSRVARWKKCRVVYDASRCFGGTNGVPPTWVWRVFPSYLSHHEKKSLIRADLILSSCQQLSHDLQNLNPGSHIQLLEDIPARPLFPCLAMERKPLTDRFERAIKSFVVCSVSTHGKGDVKKLLLALRKVVDAYPETGFFIKGTKIKDAELMAGNLDIAGNCVFLEDEEMSAFLVALDYADAALFIPDLTSRYAVPEILTMLHSPSPIVAVQHEAYASILNSTNSIPVVFSAESIAEGLLQVYREPLFSLGIATEGQQLIADHYSFSSFKHRVRMAYHGLE